MQHTEIVWGPVDIYIAPVGETWPEIQATPAGNWAKLGESGNENYSGDGVHLRHEQTIVQKRTVGSTGPVKAKRTEENLIISGILEDLTPEDYTKILNNASVAETAADADTGGYHSITLRQGQTVSTKALLIRGEDLSPYGETYNFQYEVPVVYQSGSPELVFGKEDSAGCAFEFTALEYESAATALQRFGHYRAQDAAPTG